MIHDHIDDKKSFMCERLVRQSPTVYYYSNHILNKSLLDEIIFVSKPQGSAAAAKYWILSSIRKIMLNFVVPGSLYFSVNLWIIVVYHISF